AFLKLQAACSGLPARLLKNFVGSQWTPYVGSVAVVSLLSTGAFRMEDLWAPTVNAETARHCEEAIAELMKVGLLLEIQLEEGRLYRFAEDGIAAYLWLLSVEGKLQDAAMRPVTEPSFSLRPQEVQS